MNKIDKIDLFEKYHNDEASSQEVALFEKMCIEDLEFAEDYAIFCDSLVAIEAFGPMQLKAELQELESKIQWEIVMAQEKEEAPAEKQGIFSLDRLLQLFAPSPTYHSVVHFANRSHKKFGLAAPSNGLDLDQNLLRIELTNAVDDDAHISFEDNLLNQLLKASIPAGKTALILDIDHLELSPGRYYCRVFAGKEVVIRELFYKKELLPEQYAN